MKFGNGLVRQAPHKNIADAGPSRPPRESQALWGRVMIGGEIGTTPVSNGETASVLKLSDWMWRSLRAIGRERILGSLRRK